MSKSLIFAHFLFFGEWCEWIAHFAQIKWAIWANCSFRSPKMSEHERFAQYAQRKWAMWANRSFHSPKMSKWVNCSFFWVNRSFAHFLTKTSASLGNQMSEFPALQSRAMTTFELFSLNPIEEGVAALVRLVVGGRGGGRGRLMLVGGWIGGEGGEGGGDVEGGVGVGHNAGILHWGQALLCLGLIRHTTIRNKENV